MIDVMLFGEPMVIFYANNEGPLENATSFSKGLAGAEVNVGIGVTRLGHNVNYMTKLNKDEFGKYIHDCLKKEKLDSTYISFDTTKQVGLMFKNKVIEGDPKTLYYRKNTAASTLSIEDAKKIDFKEVKVLHITGIPPALSESSRQACFYMMRAARKEGCYITFDPNLRLDLWESKELMISTLNELASLSDVVIPGISEGELLTGLTNVEAIADFYLNQGSKIVIVKVGSKGAYFKEMNKEIQFVKGFKVEQVVDTIGAGDGFATGIIDGYLSNSSTADAVKQANAIGAIQVQNISDNEGLPTRKELLSFLEMNN